MKKCTKCLIEKESNEFHKRGKILQANCKACKSLDQKQRRERNKEQFNAKKWERCKLRKEKLKEFVFNYLLANPCIKCGESDPIVLEFDHRGDKEFHIATGINNGYSLEKIKHEMTKCDVLCANCHKRKTAQDFNWYKLKLMQGSSNE